MSGRTKAATLLAMVVAALLAGAPPVSAHGELVASSPGPGETVGRATHIDLIFSTEVFDWRVTVEDPAGEMVGGSTVQRAESYLSFEAVPLAEDGQYIVRYSAVDDDGDLVEGAFAFVLEAGAPPPTGLPDDLVVLQDSGWPWWLYGVLLAVVVVIAVLAGLLAEKLRRLRATAGV